MHVPIHGMLLQMHHTTAWHHGNWYHGMHKPMHAMIPVAMMPGIKLA